LEAEVQSNHVRTVIGILIAAGFSWLYLIWYPLLIGGFVIYYYPYWPPALAAAYVAGGILLQAGMCYWRGTAVTWRSLGIQVLTGTGYLIATLFVSDMYQS
jgi:hypothetical protein